MDEGEAEGCGLADRRGSPRPSLHVVDGGAPPDQALRLRQFREDHPDVEVILRGPWQAIIPEPDGETVIIRWELRELLDELDRRLVSGEGDSADKSAHSMGFRQ